MTIYLMTIYLMTLSDEDVSYNTVVRRRVKTGALGGGVPFIGYAMWSWLIHAEQAESRGIH